jgi:hypothetical protein
MPKSNSILGTNPICPDQNSDFAPIRFALKTETETKRKKPIHCWADEILGLRDLGQKRERDEIARF